MDQKGYATLAEFRGNACGRIKGNDDIDRVKRMVAQIDEQKCLNCGLCGRVCIYDAPVAGKHAFSIPAEACDGCGLCPQLCPASAITMVPLAEPRTFELGVK